MLMDHLHIEWLVLSLPTCDWWWSVVHVLKVKYNVSFYRNLGHKIWKWQHTFLPGKHMQCTIVLHQLTEPCKVSNNHVCKYSSLYRANHINVEFRKVREQGISCERETSMTLWSLWTRCCINSQAKSNNTAVLVIPSAHTFRSMDK